MMAMKRGIVFGLFVIMSSSIAMSQDLSIKASAFLQSLDSKLKSQIQYKIDDEERFNWHFVPRRRNGPTFHDFSETQRQAAMDLLKASLSQQGYEKTTGILALEKILQGVEGRDENDSYRDSKNYHFTIFGDPSPGKPWGWRLEGHHISLNFMSTNGKIVSSTPSFFGANPAVVPSGKNKGMQVLKAETELGFSLVNSLTDQQRKKAVFDDRALFDIVSSNDRKAKQLDPKGIMYPELSVDQQKMFLQLLDVYVLNYELGFSTTLMNKIKKAGINNLSFAWAGSLKPGAGHYYRIQGPMLLIEYDNTQNNANHVHSVVRDLTNDFAEDILREHYLKEH
jgi:hypothetical protein